MSDASQAAREAWTILLVSGESAKQQEIRRLLLDGSDRPYAFVECTPSVAALSAVMAARTGGFDCILLDDDGEDTPESSLGVVARAPAFASSPVVVLTSRGRARESSFLSLGVQEVVSKDHLHAQSLTRAVENAAERFALRSQLEERDLRLRLAVEAADLGLWTWDLQTDAVTWSAEVYRMLGVSVDSIELTGTAFFAMIHAEDGERVEASVRAATRERTLYRAEFRLHCPDGRLLWVENRGRAVYDASGVPLRMLGTIADVSERRRSERALAFSEAFANRMVEASADCVAGLSHDGRFVWMNPHALSVLGLHAAQVGTFTLLSLWNGESARRDARDALAAAASGRTGRFTGQLDAPGGQRWLDVVLTFLPTPPDEEPQLLCVARDVSEAKKAEEERRRVQRTMQSVIDGSNALIFAKDLDGTYFLSNRAWRRFVGVTEEARAVTDVDVFPADVAAMLREHDALALRSHEPLSFEESTIVDGRVVTYLVSKFPLVDGDGQPYAVCGVAVNVTQLKETQRALSRRERELQTLADNCPDVIARFDRQGRHVFVNAAVERATGRAPAELLGKTNQQLGMSPELCRRWDAALAAVFTSAAPTELAFDFERAGQTYSYTARLVPELDDAGRVQHVLCVTTDRTLQRQHERLLQETNQRKDEFLAVLAHELRNPLAPLRTGLEVLRDSAVRAERERAQQIMQRQVDHMVRLVDDLLDVSRIGAGRIELRREQVELRKVVDQAVEATRPLFVESQHTLRLELPDEPVWLHADSTRVAQILGNLLNNAGKYTPERGQVELRATLEPGHVRICVTDTGVGLPAEMLPVVFDMFTQLEPSLHRARGGLGIGLALVRNLVELHGGSVKAESQGPGKGSTFTVTFPLADAPAAAAGGASSESAASPQKVLVVDDNVDGAEMLVTMFQLEGHVTRMEHDGRSALAAAAELGPDIIFLDIGLPDVSGYEVARRLREDAAFAHVTLVALTGWGAQGDKARATEAGFDYHLTKPVDFEAVQAIMKGRGAHPQRLRG